MQTLQKKQTGKVERLTEITILLPNKVIDKLDCHGSLFGRGTEESAVETIERALGKEVPLNERFFPRRHFDIPKDTFILSALTHEEWVKLWHWHDSTDQINIYPDAYGEIVILNETRLGKWNRRKARKMKPKA